MDSQQFKEAATSSIDESESFHLLCMSTPLTPSPVVSYFDNLAQRSVVSQVEPGYLRKILPSEAPQEGESWPTIQADIESKIMPGITHWYSSPPHYPPSRQHADVTQATPLLPRLLPLRLLLPRHPRRALLGRPVGGLLQLDLLPGRHRARDNRPRLAGQDPRSAVCVPVHRPYARWRRDSGECQ